MKLQNWECYVHTIKQGLDSCSEEYLFLKYKKNYKRKPGLKVLDLMLAVLLKQDCFR